ncbi:MAG: Stk1 family PASTA domain-containing Ser/Thr kinase [Peptococcaceae bacterium]|nr:Stk1 family PASTA domain-containing Ser/Thr kinase [Peptococcaceae bacterium]
MTKVFGRRYEVIEQIGSGGMAIVYKAKDILLNRIVTIKVLREQFLSDEDFIRRFRREAQSAASLSHTNIVSIYDVGKDGEIEYIVMEYVEGRNLKEIIRNYAPLLPDQAIYITKQIAEAIKHAHAHKIIHRDIKPHNILITEDGGAKVTDFGIARAVSAATVTHTGDIVGSVHYLSPEQARGVQSNEQSDLYSLGIILYELLTGKIPYDGETPIAIALKHLQEQPVPPSKLNPKIRPELEAVIMKAIAKDAEERYASADALLRDLERIQDGRPIAERKEEQRTNDLERTQVHKSLRPLGYSEVKPGKNTGAAQWLNGIKRKNLGLGLGLIAAFLLIFGGLSLYRYFNVAETSVPNLVGKSLEEAETLLTSRNLILGKLADEYSDTVKEGLIIRQSKPQDTKIKIGNEIQVTVSSGPELIPMPDLKNLNREEALNKLLSTGFAEEKITFKLLPSETVPEGYVADQTPPARSPWTKNSNIDVWLSNGPQVEMVTVPPLMGYSWEMAEEILLGLNLYPVRGTQNSGIYGANTVIETSPKAGDSIEQGGQVIVTVSIGPGPVGKADADGRLLLNLRLAGGAAFIRGW